MQFTFEKIEVAPFYIETRISITEKEKLFLLQECVFSTEGGAILLSNDGTYFSSSMYISGVGQLPLKYRRRVGESYYFAVCNSAYAPNIEELLTAYAQYIYTSLNPVSEVFWE